VDVVDPGCDEREAATDRRAIVGAIKAASQGRESLQR
jgi:hypothetical protein